MGLGERLAFLVGADGVTETVAGFGKVAAAAKAAATETTAQLAKLTAAAQAAEAKAAVSADKVVRGIGGASGIARNQAAADRATAEAQKARNDIAGIESGAAQGGAAGGVLETLGVGGAAGAAVVAGVTVAGAAIAKFTDDAVGHYQRLGGQVLEFQRAAGGSAEQDSRLVNVFNQLGVQTDAAGLAIFRLGKNAEGSGKGLAAVGVEVARNKDGSVDLTGTLANVTGAYGATDNAAERAAIAFAAFGRQGAALLPILAQNKDQLQALFAGSGGEIFSQQDLDNIEQARAAAAELKQSVGGLQNAVGRALTPFATNFTRGLEVLGEHLGVFNQRQDQANAALAEWTDAQQKATAAAERATAAEEAQIAAEQKHDAALTSLVGTLTAVQSADDAVAQARHKVAEAELGAAQKVRDEATATQSLTAANEALAKAEYDQSQAAAVAAENQKRNALAVSDATYAEADARDAVNKAVEEYGANSREAAEARNALAGKELDLQDAQRKKNAPDTTVQDAANAVADARDRQLTAQDAVNKAEAEDPAAALMQANKDLAAAVSAERDAQQKAADAIKDTTIKTGDLKAEFDGLIADMKAAGVDPSVIAVYTNIEGAAIAARNAQTPQSGEGETLPPGAVGPVAPPAGTVAPPTVPNAAQGAAAVGGYVGAAPPPQSPSGASQGAAASGAVAAGGYVGAVPPEEVVRTQSVDNSVHVNVTTNADPNEIAHAIVFAQAVRR